MPLSKGARKNIERITPSQSAQWQVAGSAPEVYEREHPIMMEQFWS
jgi:hypothetical protein